jgi:type I restriction enzyme M protein
MAFDGNMNINFYVKRDHSGNEESFEEILMDWINISDELNSSMSVLFESNH